jgi:DNA processing protein
MKSKEWSIFLSLAPGVGAKTYSRLITALGSAKAVFEASKRELEAIPGIRPSVIETLLSPGTLLEKGEKVLRDLQEQKIGYITLGQEGYPLSLKTIPYPPPVLYCKGDSSILKEPCFTVVGTRGASPYGLDMAFNLSRGLAHAGLVIISGLARGIDTAAHRGALSTGTTAAFLGSGLDSLYPPENRRLAQSIVEKGGAIFSPYPLETPPERGHFPRRNLLMAALGTGVLVVEAGEKSGALMTVHYARNMGKEIFALPGPVGPSRTKGVHILIKEGAHLIEDTQDILNILHIKGKKAPEKPPMSETEKRVWETLEEGALPIEVLMEKCDLTLQEAYSLLLQMELKGLVASGGGNIFMRRAL